MAMRNVSINEPGFKNLYMIKLVPVFSITKVFLEDFQSWCTGKEMRLVEFPDKNRIVTRA